MIRYDHEAKEKKIPLLSDKIRLYFFKFMNLILKNELALGVVVFLEMTIH